MKLALSILFSVIPISSWRDSFVGQYCQKTGSGMTLCVKKENILCETIADSQFGDRYRIECKMSGVLKDLAGNKSHWTSVSDKYAMGEYVSCYYSFDYNGTLPASSLTCNAANNFKIISKQVVLNRRVQFQLRKEKFLESGEELLICRHFGSGYNPRSDVLTFAFNPKSPNIDQIVFNFKHKKMMRRTWVVGMITDKVSDFEVNYETYEVGDIGSKRVDRTTVRASSGKIVKTETFFCKTSSQLNPGREIIR